MSFGDDFKNFMSSGLSSTDAYAAAAMKANPNYASPWATNVTQSQVQQLSNNNNNNTQTSQTPAAQSYSDESSPAAGSKKTTASLIGNMGDDPVSVEMRDGYGYIGNQRVTEAYPGVKWVSTGSVQQPGGAYGYYENYINEANSNGGQQKGIPVPGIKKQEEPVKEKTQSPLQGLWSGGFDMLKQYVPQPTTTSVPDISHYTKIVEDQLAPILNVQLANLAANKKKNRKTVENDLIGRGFFGQLPSLEKLEAFEDDYDDSEAKLRADFLSNVSDKATSLYNTEVNRVNEGNSQYNQSMLNLGMAAMQGMIDQERYISDNAYRQAVMARYFGEDAANLFGNL